eukprot:TRINITY_DN27001_c0_g2_i1.p1 TRINITY_DN27001_c0_g2~~TRINITY_DN27001_c0_g2_i1.p1  ORF type:complete len:497 (-),score=25.07 TRINITY_DN27001_c0_g2_i1:180-1670(-)
MYLSFFAIIVCGSIVLNFVVGKYFEAGIFRLAVVTPFVAYLLYFPLGLDTKQYAILFGTVMVFCFLAAIKVIGFGIGSGPLVYKNWTTFQFFVVFSSLVVPWEFKQDENRSPSSSYPYPFYDPYTRQGYTHFQIIYWCFIRMLILLPGSYFTALYGNHIVGFWQTIIFSIGLMLIAELLLTSASLLCQSVLDVPLMLPFARPQFSESFKEFWGKRWDTAVGGLFRTVIFQPIRIYVQQLAQQTILLQQKDNHCNNNSSKQNQEELLYCLQNNGHNNSNNKNYQFNEDLQKQEDNQYKFESSSNITSKSNSEQKSELEQKKVSQLTDINYDDNNFDLQNNKSIDQQQFDHSSDDNNNFRVKNSNSIKIKNTQQYQMSKKYNLAYKYSDYAGVAAGLLSAFFASTVLHEYVVLQYDGQITGEMSLFFMLQPVLIGIEQIMIINGFVVKMRWLRIILVVGIQCMLGQYLFFPPFIRSGASTRIIEELNICISYIHKLVS